MEKESMLPFKVGDSAECRSFQSGYRGAWFRCKIKDICRKEGNHLVHALEFFDFPDEKIKMTRVYQFPGRKVKETKRQLMVRPKYPPIYHDNQIPDASTISEASVVVNGPWEIGDLVDWWSDGCYWCGTITEVFPDEQVQIVLLPQPIGEGSSYEAFCKDLRPSLDWSPEIGWSVQGGESSRRRVIKPLSGEELSLGTDKIVQDVQAVAASKSDASFSSQVSANSSPPANKSNNFLSGEIPGLSPVKPEREERCPETSSRQEMDDSGAEKTIVSDSVSTSHVRDTPAEKVADPTGEDQSDDCSGSSKKRKSGGSTFLNCMQSDTVEAAIMDLEELVCKIKWMKGILETGTSDSAKSQWKFHEHRSASKPT